MIRWLLHSVPARQLRRTVIGPQLVVVVVVIGLLASGSAGGIAISDFSDGMSGLMSGSDNPPDDPRDPSTVDDGGYDNAQVRAAFLAFLNDERNERGLQQLSLRPELTAMGEAHAANMAKHDYIGHVWPDGTTMEDRYRNRGLLPECRLQISGSNRFYSGAENAAGAWVNRRFRSSGGSYYVSNESELAGALFDIWMNSPPHREAMLVRSADQMGLGINITDRGKVYAALELC